MASTAVGTAMTAWIFRLALLGALWLPLDAAPAECQDREGELLPRGYDLTLKAITQCLGDRQRDGDPLVQAFNDATPDTENAEMRLTALVEAVKLLQGRVEDRLAQNVQAEDWNRVAAQLSVERGILDTMTSEMLTASRDSLFADAFWAFDRGQIAGGQEEVIDAWRPTCTTGVSPCPAYESQKELIRAAVLVQRLRGYARAKILTAHQRDAALQSERWRAYFSDSLPQYWWEVLINGWRMGENLCPKDRQTRIQQGFCKVPTNQLIVLHPDAGLEWNADAERSDELKPVFLIEVFGWYQWRFEKGSATLRDRVGISVVAAYGDRNETPDWSYGIMLHAGSGFNVAVTTNSNEDVGVLVNLNLAKFVFERKQAYTDYLKALEKPSARDLLLGNWPPKLP